jgi:hypothetical protein
MYIHCTECLFQVGDVIPPASVHGHSATSPSGVRHPTDHRYDDEYVYIWEAPTPRDVTGGVWSDYRFRYRVRPIGELDYDPQFGVGGPALRCAAAEVLERFDWNPPT